MVNPFQINRLDESIVYTQLSPCGKWLIEIEIDYTNQSFQVVWNENPEIPGGEEDFISDQ